MSSISWPYDTVFVKVYHTLAVLRNFFETNYSFLLAPNTISYCQTKDNTPKAPPLTPLPCSMHHSLHFALADSVLLNLIFQLKQKLAQFLPSVLCLCSVSFC